MSTDFNQIAMTVEQTDNNEMKGKYLTFWTDGQVFGVPISDVVQIIGVQSITPVPEFPSYAKGVIDLRSSIIPIIDIRLRMGKEEKPYDERTCIIVISINENLTGIVVDAVEEVTDIGEDSISAPPRMSESDSSEYIEGIAKIEKLVVLLLSTSKLLGDTALDI